MVFDFNGSFVVPGFCDVHWSELTTKYLRTWSEKREWKMENLEAYSTPSVPVVSSHERSFVRIEKSTWWKMALEHSRREKKKLHNGCRKWKITRSDLILCCMKLFDSFHNLYSFIVEHGERRNVLQTRESEKVFKYSRLECWIHITFHSWIDKFDYFYARAMINSSSIIWYSFNCSVVKRVSSLARLSC